MAGIDPEISNVVSLEDARARRESDRLDTLTRDEKIIEEAQQRFAELPDEERAVLSAIFGVETEEQNSRVQFSIEQIRDLKDSGLRNLRKPGGVD